MRQHAEHKKNVTLDNLLLELLFFEHSTFVDTKNNHFFYVLVSVLKVENCSRYSDEISLICKGF